MNLTKAKQEEQVDAIRQLRLTLTPGETVYTVLRHTSRSGMYRAIDLYHLSNGERDWLSRRGSTATGIRFDKRHEAMGAGGCGMDMGFSLVYELSSALYPDGFECIGEECPSNDHSNGDRDYSPHHHKSGGYALRHRWL